MGERTDTERLNWLSDQHGPESANENGSPVCVHRIKCVGTEDVRRAIDAAMEAEADG